MNKTQIEDQDEDFHSLKILTIGESGVGKSSIILRYTENKFSESFLSTIGIDFKTKIDSYQNKRFCLKIWDTAGQERFKTITQQYYKGSDVNLLIFDVTNSNSFSKLQSWVNNILEIIGSCIFILVGNKSDLISDKIVENENINEFCQLNKMKYIEVSAKTGHNIDQLFELVIIEYLNKSKDKSILNSSTNISESLIKEINDSKLNSKNKKIKITKENRSKKSNKCCKKN